MANKDEFRVATPPPPPQKGPRVFHSSLGKGCPKCGFAVGAYYKPVVDFAREHLLDEEHGEVHELIVANGEKPRLADGVTIIVEPRGVVGELRVVYVGPPYYASGTRWAEAIYCLHVLPQGTTTMIAVEGFWQIYR